MSPIASNGGAAPADEIGSTLNRPCDPPRARSGLFVCPDPSDYSSLHPSDYSSEMSDILGAMRVEVDDACVDSPRPPPTESTTLSCHSVGDVVPLLATGVNLPLPSGTSYFAMSIEEARQLPGGVEFIDRAIASRVATIGYNSRPAEGVERIIWVGRRRNADEEAESGRALQAAADDDGGEAGPSLVDAVHGPSLPLGGEADPSPVDAVDGPSLALQSRTPVQPSRPVTRASTAAGLSPAPSSNASPSIATSARSQTTARGSFTGRRERPLSPPSSSPARPSSIRSRSPSRSPRPTRRTRTDSASTSSHSLYHSCDDIPVSPRRPAAPSSPLPEAGDDDVNPPFAMRRRTRATSLADAQPLPLASSASSPFGVAMHAQTRLSGFSLRFGRQTLPTPSERRRTTGSSHISNQRPLAPPPTGRSTALRTTASPLTLNWEQLLPSTRPAAAAAAVSTGLWPPPSRPSTRSLLSRPGASASHVRSTASSILQQRLTSNVDNAYIGPTWATAEPPEAGSSAGARFASPIPVISPPASVRSTSTIDSTMTALTLDLDPPPMYEPWSSQGVIAQEPPRPRRVSHRLAQARQRQTEEAVAPVNARNCHAPVRNPQNFDYRRH